MKKLGLITATLFVVLCLGGCKPTIVSGQVVEKSSATAHHTTVIRYGCTNTSKGYKPACLPSYEYIPNPYSIRIQSQNPETGRIVYATFHVTEERYNSLEIGDSFAFDSSKGDLY